MIKRILISIFLIVLVVQPSTATIAQVMPIPIELLTSWGAEGNVINVPTDIAVTQEGHILVTNYMLSRLTRIIPGEESFVNIGGNGYEPGMLPGPRGISLASDGTIYVVTSCNLHHFDSDGNFLWRTGSCGSESGQFSNGISVEAGVDESVFVLDGQYPRVLKYSNNGNYITEWKLELDEGEIDQIPVSIKLGPDGILYVLDSLNLKIEWYSTSGEKLGSWGSRGSEDEEWSRYSDIAFDSNGNMYVANYGKARIVVVSPDRTTVHYIYNTLDSNWNPQALSFDLEGNLIVTEFNTSRVQIFSQTGMYLKSYGIPQTTPGQFSVPNDILSHSNSDIYVLDTGNARVQRFDQLGNLISLWGEWGESFDQPDLPIEIEREQFNSPLGIEQDLAGNLYIVDNGKKRISKYAPDGTWLYNWKIVGSDPALPVFPMDIAIRFVDGVERVYVLVMVPIDDSNNLSGIQTFDLAGNNLNNPELW